MTLDGLRVLVVDDDEDARAVLRLLLAGYGADVRVAGSCEEALGLLAGAEVDVLVSDIGMPGQDGWDLIRQIRGGAVPRHAAIPAVALTGLVRLQDRVALLRAGFQAHLSKPVNSAEAVALVRALAGGRTERPAA
jgi:CheY-like chemotaxis protein